jgi:hypothetical protein
MSVDAMKLAEMLAPTMDRGIKARFFYLFVGLMGFLFPALIFSVVAKSAAKVLKEVPEDKMKEIMKLLDEDHD